MSISKLAQSIKEPATLRLTRQAHLLHLEGKPVIHLGAGEPKSKMPTAAIKAAIEKIESGQLRYTPTQGTPELIEAIIGYTEINYSRVPSQGNVIVTTGAKQSFYTFMMTIINPGDEVIIFAPYWVSYPEIVRICGGKAQVISPPEGSFIPEWSRFESAISERTRAVVVNSPNNPSGAVYPSELVSRLVQFCEEREIYLVMDDIYHKLAFNKSSPANCFEFTSRPIDESRLIILNGVSKLYAMTGVRIGWTVANREVIAGMINLAAQNYSCPSAINQVAATAALSGEQSCVDNLRKTLAENCSLMANELASIPNVSLRKPQGTFYCFPDFSNYDSDSENLAAMLLKRALVVTIPGIEFGMEGHLRLSVCGSADDIRNGVARIRWALDTDSPDEITIGDKRVKRDWLKTV